MTEEIEKSDEGDRVKRARERELTFYERAIRNDPAEVKRKAEEVG